MLIEFENMTFSYAGDVVLDCVSFTLHENERVGFVGANGAGKTTLLRLIVGQLRADAGNVTVKSNAKIGYLEQTGGFESTLTVYEAMEEVFAEDKELLSRLEAVQKEMEHADETALKILSAKQESLLKRIAARDSYRYDVRIKTVLNGMGFQKTYRQTVATMSGGEKTRLKLCRLLLEQPDLLILDEPTNHLDIATLFWLEEYLSSYRGALLVVSPDRYFLDKLTTRTLELECKKIHSYKGNYTAYKSLKAERVLHDRREYEKQQEEIKKLETYVAKNIVRATTAKSAQSRVKQLDRMEKLAPPPPPPAPPRFSFTYETPPYERVLACDGFSLEIGGKTLINNASFSLLRGDRCALIGENGTGKSTLMRFFLSDDPRVKIGRNVTVAYYDQENADLDPEARVIDAFWEKHVLLQQTDVRKALAQAGLYEDDVFKKAGELSGGQRARLELSLLQAKHANTLFLDEPTNHLDLGAREALEDALKAFDGTLLFVSHDRRFIEAIATRIVLLEQNGLTFFNGTYTEYLKSKTAAPPPAKTPSAPKATEGYRTKEERAKEAQTRNRIKELENAIPLLETEAERLNAEWIARAADYRAAQELSAKIEELNEQIEKLYEEYESLIG